MSKKTLIKNTGKLKITLMTALAGTLAFVINFTGTLRPSQSDGNGSVVYADIPSISESVSQPPVGTDPGSQSNGNGPSDGSSAGTGASDGGGGCSSF